MKRNYVLLCSVFKAIYFFFLPNGCGSFNKKNYTNDLDTIYGFDRKEIYFLFRRLRNK